MVSFGIYMSYQLFVKIYGPQMPREPTVWLRPCWRCKADSRYRGGQMEGMIQLIFHTDFKTTLVPKILLGWESCWNCFGHHRSFGVPSLSLPARRACLLHSQVCLHCFNKVFYHLNLKRISALSTLSISSTLSLRAATYFSLSPHPSTSSSADWEGGNGGDQQNRWLGKLCRFCRLCRLWLNEYIIRDMFSISYIISIYWYINILIHW